MPDYKYPWQEREFIRKGKKPETKINMGHPVLIEVAQKLFNTYIRERDKDKGCISCGAEVEHAGHYLPQGANSALRFNEINVNGCCAYCNTYLSGNQIKTRLGLIAKYGLEQVEKLESSERFKKWSHGELNMIIQLYKPSKYRKVKQEG